MDVDAVTADAFGSSVRAVPAGVWCHETACVDEPSAIRPGMRIGPYAHIMAGARIGNDCQIGRNVVIAATAVIGNGVKVGNNVVVDDGVVLEDGVFCGPGVTFATVARPRSERLDAYSRQRILVRQGATLGANATVLGGVTVHMYAMVGAGAVVTDDVPRYAVMTGVPARRSSWLCRCTESALDFAGTSVRRCPVCGRLYRMSHPGPEEFSREEEQRQHKADCLKFLTRGHGKQ